jgi:hypothetical protein
MKFQLAVCLLVIAFAGSALAAPRVPLPVFTRAQADARIAAISSARAASGAECVDCETVLGEVIHTAIGNLPQGYNRTFSIVLICLATQRPAG